jgi:Xaa-Pro aminopeptidase
MTVDAAPAGALPTMEPMDRPARLARLRAELSRWGGDAGVDAILVNKPANIRWLSGFTGSNGQLLVTSEEVVAITDGRYQDQIADQLAEAGLEATVEITVADVGRLLAQHLGSRTRLGVEAHQVTWHQRDQLADWLPAIELVALNKPLEELRKLKDGGERSRLVRAAAIADGALAATAPLLETRPTERQVARRLEQLMYELGADGLSFETIVASGPNSALPHARPSNRVIEPGDLVVVDFGAAVDGYGSDMTRTFVIGGQASSEQLRLYDAVIAAQAAGVAAVADGVEERAIDEACRSVLTEAGLGEAFSHSTGHAIGLEIHEDPILSARSVGILRSGYVVTVEPGVYVHGVGGVRIEDSVVVGPGGCLPITHSPKRLAPVPG